MIPVGMLRCGFERGCVVNDSNFNLHLRWMSIQYLETLSTNPYYSIHHVTVYLRTVHQVLCVGQHRLECIVYTSIKGGKKKKTNVETSIIANARQTINWRCWRIVCGAVFRRTKLIGKPSQADFIYRLGFVLL